MDLEELEKREGKKGKKLWVCLDLLQTSMNKLPKVHCKSYESKSEGKKNKTIIIKYKEREAETDR